MIVSTILRGGTPDRRFVLVGAKYRIEVVIVSIHHIPFVVVSPFPLCLEVPQGDITSLGVSRITLRVRSVCVMSGEPVLRGVSEQPLSEPDEALLPATSVVQLLCEGELLRLVGSLFSGSSPPTHEDDQEDESASESHEKNLPPLKSV